MSNRASYYYLPLGEYVVITLNRIFKDFKNMTRTKGCLCECKYFSYENNTAPNYSSPQVQQYYLLRYFPAFLAEYYFMFKIMLKEFPLEDEMRIVSIGCGCGMDLWGLFFAVNKIDQNMLNKINYTGIDLIDWQYKDPFTIKRVKFLITNINEYREFKKNEFNIIVLPKSITEFSDESFSSFCEKLRKSNFAANRINLVCSLRDEKKAYERYDNIKHILSACHGFESRGKCEYVGKDVGMKEVVPEFVYPQDIINYLIKMKEQCPEYLRKNKSCRDDCGDLNWFPILKAKYMIFNMDSFIRK